jgi:hypothetical protein
MSGEMNAGCGFRPTADCGRGTSDFDPLRTAEEELRISTHCGLRRRNFGFRRTEETVQQEILTSVRYPQASTRLAAHVCTRRSEFLTRSPQRVEVRSSSSAVRSGSKSEVPPPQSAVGRSPKFLFRSPQWVETRIPHSSRHSSLASTPSRTFSVWPAMPW